MSLADATKSSLAINGGQPVRASVLPYGRQSVDEEDIAAVVEVLRSDWITTGPKVDEFEQAVADYVGAKYSVAFSSGTAALHGAAIAADLGPGDEAITTPITFCATANCVLYVGATPVFADVSPDTLNLDPDEVEKRITPKTKAVLPVDYCGHPVDLERFLAMAEKHGLVVIEDAAHSLGATYQGKIIGGQAHMTIFSFHPVKHITTGEGGMVTTNDAELARRLKMARSHGIDGEARRTQGAAKGPWFYEMEELGYNYRLSDISCALGLSQLKKLPEYLSRRREIAGMYDAAFADIPGLTRPARRFDADSSWHLYVIRTPRDKFTAGRREIFDALKAENIGVNVHYIPVHLHPYYRQHFGYEGGEYPIAENAYEEMITLPLFPSMTGQDVADVVAAVDKVLTHFAKPAAGGNS